MSDELNQENVFNDADQTSLTFSAYSLQHWLSDLKLKNEFIVLLLINWSI